MMPAVMTEPKTRRVPTVALALATLSTFAVPAQESKPATRHDVVVYGGTSGGIAAALAAARAGRSVVLVEPTARIGGLTTHGLGATDIGNKAAIGGISREFYRRIRAHYADRDAWVQEAPEDFKGRGHRPGEDAAWTFEPKVALAVYDAMLAETDIDVVTDARLRLDGGGVELDGTAITAITTTDGRRFPGRVFVDATYEGDLLAKAGVSYTVGREANATYGETLNGVQVRNATKHQFSHDVDPYVVPGDPSSGLLPWIQPGGPGAEGQADHKVQAYCFRLTTTDVAANKRPWTKPAGYDERDFELVLRNYEAGDRRVPWHPVWMPNRKTDTNNNFAISLDALGLSWRWPEAGWEERERIFADHLAYTEGLLWTLAHHPRMPQEVRTAMQRFGLTRDEFVATGGWPPQLYVREGRRMVADVVMTERHCRGLDVVPDPVGMGAYGMDSHNVQRYVDADGHVRNEGDVQVHGFTPYGISYRSIVPARGECPNLLVPVAISASHIAFGSARMEPVFMVLGHSAGAAADLALERGTAVQDVDYTALRARLLAEDQVLVWQGETKRLVGIDPRGIDGVVVDDTDAELRGGWVASSSTQPYVGVGYVHDNASDKGSQSITFELRAPGAGRAAVQFAYPAHQNRAKAVTVRWGLVGAVTSTTVDQTKTPPVDGLWLPLGEIDVAAGATVVVSLSNADTTGYVVADAVRLVLRQD